MIICHCKRVTEAQLAAAVEDGAGSIREVAMRTGAGRCCGGCAPAVAQVVRAALARSSRHAEAAPGPAPEAAAEFTFAFPPRAAVGAPMEHSARGALLGGGAHGPAEPTAAAPSP